MSQSSKKNRELLLNDLLLKKESLFVASKEINDVYSPIAYCIAKEYTINENFYPNLAKVVGLKYKENLNFKVSPQGSRILQIPTKLLIDNSVYVYIKGKKIFLVVSDPFIDIKIFEEIISYTRFTEYILEIAHPELIIESLSRVYYQFFNITSQNLLKTFYPSQSASNRFLSISQRNFLIAGLILGTAFLLVNAKLFLYLIFLFLNIFYFVVNPFKIYIFFKSRLEKKFVVDKKKIEALTYKELPVYSLLIPLKNEEKIVADLIGFLMSINYPKDKLDINFAVEVDDVKTIAALNKLGIGVISDDASVLSIASKLIKVPLDNISTKPRSCNYALSYAKGTYVVIYDAEDKPDVDQLKKVLVKFSNSKLNVICVQSTLSFYNPTQNIMTRLFTLEYGFWFDYYLLGLQIIDSPLPLGGTSNHFITSVLKKIGTWDPYNVTEDADLGLRLSRFHYKTETIDSYTLEEANSKFINWLKQRSRWQKGYLQTFLVHMIHPFKLFKEIGFKKYIYVFLTFGANFFMPFLNPILIAIFVITWTPFISIDFISAPKWLDNLALVNLIFGNLTYILLHIAVAVRNKQYNLIPSSIFLPLYWLLISVATYRALYQYIFHPYKWEKTKHGLNKK